jgi:hypothetical protein
LLYNITDILYIISWQKRHVYLLKTAETDISRFRFGQFLHFWTSRAYVLGSGILFVILPPWYSMQKGVRWRGWDSNPRTPKGRDHSSRFFLFLYVSREEMVPCISDLESCAFDRASLPLRSLVLPVKPYFIVAANEIRLNLLGASTICQCLSPKLFQDCA